MNANTTCKRHWFLFAMLITIFLAEIFPDIGANGGPLKPEITVKYGATFLIYFLSGLSLKPEDLISAANNIPVHLYIQGFNFIFMPIFTSLTAIVMSRFGIDEWVLKGLVVVSCMPLSSSSPVILTRTVGGNEAAAIFNTVLGSALGIVVTPLLLLLVLKVTAVVTPLRIFIDLLTTVAFPLVLGQILRHISWLRISSSIYLNVGAIALLLVIFTTFCDTFIAQEKVEHNPLHILAAVFLVLCLQIFYTIFIFWTTCKMRKHFSPEDVVTMIYCCTHKSLTLGIPILKILYSGYHHLYRITLPMLVYYPTQIIIGGMILNELRSWLRSKKLKENQRN